MLNDQPTGGGGHDSHQNPPERTPYERDEYQTPYGSQAQYPNPYPHPYPQQGSPATGHPIPPPTGYPPMQNHWGQVPQPTYLQPSGVRVRDALSYGWRKFTANIGVWLAFMGVLAVYAVMTYVVTIAVTVVTVVNSDAFDDPYASSFEEKLPLGLIAMLAVIGTVGYFFGAVFVRGSLLELDGRTPSFGDLWRLRNLGNLALFAVVASTVNAVISGNTGPVVNVAVSVVIGLLVWFVLHFLHDHGLSAGGAMVANLRLIAANPVPLFLLLGSLLGVNFAGLLLCGVGLVFTLPVSMIAIAYAFRVLTGGPVAV